MTTKNRRCKKEDKPDELDSQSSVLSDSASERLEGNGKLSPSRRARERELERTLPECIEPLDTSDQRNQEVSGNVQGGTEEEFSEKIPVEIGYWEMDGKNYMVTRMTPEDFSIISRVVARGDFLGIFSISKLPRRDVRKSECIPTAKESDLEASICDMELIWSSPDYPEVKKDVRLGGSFEPIDSEAFERRVKESSSAKAMWRKDGTYAVGWIKEMDFKETLKLLEFSP